MLVSSGEKVKDLLRGRNKRADKMRSEGSPELPLSGELKGPAIESQGRSAAGDNWRHSLRGQHIQEVFLSSEPPTWKD